MGKTERIKEKRVKQPKEKKQKKVRTGKIRNQLLMTVGFLVAIAMLASTGISLLISYNALYEANTRWLSTVASEGKTELESWLELNEYSVNAAVSYANERDAKTARITYLESIKDDYTSIPFGMYIGYEDDFLIYPAISEEDKAQVTDIKNRDWFVSAAQNEGIQYTDTYIDTVTGETCITLSCMMEDGAVLAADVFLSEINGKLAGMELNGGQSMLINRKGEVIGASDEAKKHQLLSGIHAGLAADMEAGTVKESYVIDGESMLVTEQKLENLGWTLLVIIPESSVMEDCYSLIKASMICFVVAMVLLIAVLIVVISGMTKPILQVNSYMKKVAEGDLTETLSIKNKTEIGAMVRSVNESVSSIRGVVTDIKGAVQELENETDDCTSAADILEEQSNAINRSSEMISENMNQLSISATSVAELAGTVNEAVNDVMGKGSEAREALGSTMEATQTGQSDIEAVAAEIMSIKGSVTELAGTVGEAEALTSKISNIISVIQEIASQTNLLALNASIEAARAGEAGRGFAVVAEEIKNLADNSSCSAEDIAKLIKEVENIIDVTVSQTNENVDKIQQSVAVVDKTKQSFAVISDAVDNIHGKVNGMLEDIVKVDESAQTLAAISEEQMAGVQEIASTVTVVKEATGANLESVNNMKGSMEQLRGVVDNLKTTSNQFRAE